jgi:hypothetical protein
MLLGPLRNTKVPGVVLVRTLSLPLSTIPSVKAGDLRSPLFLHDSRVPSVSTGPRLLCAYFVGVEHARRGGRAPLPCSCIPRL